MSKAGFSIEDIQKGAKSLNSTPVQAKASSKSDDDEEASIARLEKLYQRMNGDLDLIFEELGANPEKAKKPHNRPKNATEFAEKFYKGFYSLVDDEEMADSKSHK
mmetsp:Transcript_21608/g.31441  ORF Transcript_21608/g.31441 Transcript_21608/m.31441 type:complete len:105 (+) Transcript_21608:79-393(+)|eukprot:CAMPEP_0185024340 /NCGR_PEP_ID=MMETSP1103-20130426/7372_1 /TAXON_ID=36769 /ORGANISM="Paraphysomonas bandaiensis, Strain Caron Lab Isolate" /LENGTH=104 /DNA_ID=CAMNT_0027557277 /DNA_START=54 /DNA_END=368 /DNA_ORIENTATION=-